jgi:putative membrane protein insertion efficiency factor
VRNRTRFLVATTLLCVIVVAPLAYDLSRPPDRQITSHAAVSAIGWYQATWSGHLGGRCRFTPTCSQYASVMIRRHGILRGGWRAATRIARCGPWTAAGTVDPPD